MRWNPQRRSVVLHAARPACRPAFRRALRPAHRRATYRASRRVLKYTGPTLRDITTLLNRYIKLAEAYNKKWVNPPSRFKMLGTPEERQRQMEQDLKRAYGPEAMAARASQPPPPPKPVAQFATAPPIRSSPRSQSREIRRDDDVPLARLLHKLFGMG